MRELLDGLHLTCLHNFLILLLQLGHSGGTCTRGTLIGSHMNTLDMTELLQGLQYHDHHNGRTVRVCDNTTRTIQGILSVTLRNNQGHIIVHTECTGVVNHHAAVLRDGLCKFLRCTSTGTGKGDVNILEVVIMLQQLHS